MPSLTLKDIPAPLMERLRQRAARDQLSLDREAIRLLEQALEQSAEPVSQALQQREAQLAAWRRLAGRWQGDCHCVYPTGAAGSPSAPLSGPDTYTGFEHGSMGCTND